ncbi:MAG: SDR family oxidoreductase [Pseudomonadota bacterium]
MQKTVLVTGDSSGIGRATCEQLARTGWKVFGASRRDLATDGWTHLTMDVTDEASVARCLDTIVKDAGQLDAVVHSAGQSFVGAVEEATIEETTKHFDLNVFGTVRVLRAALPIMRKQGGGKIIVIGSIGGLIGLPFHAYYSAGKFALDGLVEGVRPEVSPFGIDVSIVHPGDINTEIGQHRVATANSDAGSPYHGAYTKFVAHYAQAEHDGSPPELVARHIEAALAKRKMPVRSLAGKTLEKLGVVAKRLMLSKHFEVLMSVAYSPGSENKK